MEFVVVTGLSGAGKSQAIKIMEDIGFYCMDNLPPSLISKFLDLCYSSESDIRKVALVVDMRSGGFFEGIIENLENIKKHGYSYKVVFLDAKDEVLIKRYKELRRPHPMSQDGNIVKGIETEREKLSAIKEKADYVIDTSHFTLGMLKEEMTKIFLEGKQSDSFNIFINSFGFKYGLPLESDLVFDVRFLPNPYYIDELRNLTGNDLEVQEYVMSFEESKEFLNKLTDMMSFLVPLYKKEGKSQLIVSIGCTGGKHRSVTMVNKLSNHLIEEGYKVITGHRDSQNWFRKKDK